MLTYPYALQLYSVRDYMEKNPADGLKLVKEAGYSHVEMAGDYNLSAFALRNMLEACELTPVSMHAGYDQIMNSPQKVVQQAHTLMISYVVVPWLGAEMCPTRDAWLEAAESMDDAGALLRESGLQLCYHNHAHEFELVEDETIFDLIFGNSDPDNLKMELDLCWAAVGKADISDLLSRYADRIPLVHVKDCKTPETGKDVAFTELGKGIMNYDTILPTALDAGARWFIVEQDTSEMDSMESARINEAFMHQANQ